jgi:hypothetical protein
VRIQPELTAIIDDNALENSSSLILNAGYHFPYGRDYIAKLILADIKV